MVNYPFTSFFTFQESGVSWGTAIYVWQNTKDHTIDRGSLYLYQAPFDTYNKFWESLIWVKSIYCEAPRLHGVPLDIS